MATFSKCQEPIVLRILGWCQHPNLQWGTLRVFKAFREALYEVLVFQNACFIKLYQYRNAFIPLLRGQERAKKVKTFTRPSEDYSIRIFLLYGRASRVLPLVRPSGAGLKAIYVR